MSAKSVKEIKKILLEEDVVESDVLRQLLTEERFGDVTIDEIREILNWSGDEEYVSAEDILDDVITEVHMKLNHNI